MRGLGEPNSKMGAGMKRGYVLEMKTRAIRSTMHEYSNCSEEWGAVGTRLKKNMEEKVRITNKIPTRGKTIGHHPLQGHYIKVNDRPTNQHLNEEQE